jgi:hypothetical protein
MVAGPLRNRCARAVRGVRTCEYAEIARIAEDAYSPWLWWMDRLPTWAGGIPTPARTAARLREAGDVGETMPHGEAALLREAHHVIGADRGAADAQNAIAALHQPHRDRVEHFIERRIADPG